MALNKTQLSAMSRLFSSGVFKELAKKGSSPLFARLYAETGLLNKGIIAQDTVSTAYESAFSVLRKSGLRDEYVYRAALTHNIMLGRHTLKTASMLSEFRAGNCKADLVILNGSATVYEIKSDRDSLARLANQIENYRKVFAKIYVIAGKAHIQEVMNYTSTDIGVLSLSRWNRISTFREAVERQNMLCPVTMFDSLRVSEAKQILKNLNIPVADVPNTLLRSVMRSLFENLAPEHVHREMVSVLKRTRSSASLSPLVEKLPASLQPAALSIPIHNADHNRLISAVNTPLNEAMAWM